MGKEKYYPNHCPVCGVQKYSRKRDVGKMCKSCNMKAIELLYRDAKRKDNPQTGSESHKKYREKYSQDKTYRIKKLYEQAKQRSKKSGLEFSISFDYVLSKFPSNGCCPVLGLEIKFNKVQREHDSPSLDRIDSTKGYTASNIQIVSWRANRLKADATLEELEKNC
jgi:hypothetical protein